MKIGSNCIFLCLLFLLAGVLLAPGGLAGVAPPAQNHSHDQHPAPATSVQQSHSGHQHQHETGTVHEDHLERIAAFKKTVPEDYRIMERTPVIDSQESVFSGRKAYVLHCAGCHGSLGRGDGAKAGKVKIPPADFLDFKHSEQYGPGEKYWLIVKGSKSLGMPAHPDVPPKDVWHMVNYILALQAKVKSEGYDKPPHIH